MIIYKKLIICFSISLTVFSINVYAGVYRYQDEKGKWHFTDKPPAEDVKHDILETDKKPEETNQNNSGENLAEYLTEKIKPTTDIEKATLAVVKVQTSVGLGTGFFVSDTGYIVTNKHVVRPSTTKQSKNEMKEAERKFETSKAYLNDRSKNLKLYKKDLADYKKQWGTDGQYNDHLKRYKKMKVSYKKAKTEYDKAYKKLGAYKSRMNASSVSNEYKITFKGGSLIKKAKLIKLSKKHDLALLKLKGNYTTPLLSLGSRHDVSHGGEVYAMGTPLGLTDSITKGIVTRNTAEQIYTDAKIYPGNSGGPLTTPKGTVIGVNTQVLRKGDIGTEIFGIAIPVDIVKQEFGSYF